MSYAHTNIIWVCIIMGKSTYGLKQAHNISLMYQHHRTFQTSKMHACQQCILMTLSLDKLSLDTSLLNCV